MKKKNKPSGVTNIMLLLTKSKSVYLFTFTCEPVAF